MSDHHCRRRQAQSCHAAAIALVFMGFLVCALARPGAAVAGSLPPIDDSDRVVLRHNVHPLARPELDAGRTRADYAMRRMVLSLGHPPGARAALERLVAEQHDPASPRYHQWLAPADFGARFGLDDDDLRRIAGWLESHGFTIDEVAKGRGWINFSGTAGQVEKAFATEMHDYRVEGTIRHANSVDPSIPRALSGVVNGIVSLHTFPLQPQHHVVRRLQHGLSAPSFTSGGSNYLAPADFATIYHLGPAYGAGTSGAGQTIAIVARTDLLLADVQSFRSFFGLPANDPVFIVNGTDPGNLGGNEELEADLDTEWSGAVAPLATIDVVISASTVTDGVDLSAQYIVDNNLAPVMSTSFGQCESVMGSTELAFFDGVWSQAASQGITAFVSSGDSGAEGCATSSGRAVNGVCSSTHDVCVGGTQFDDTANPSLYWAATNNPVTQGSALSYIPEISWNEANGATGGGASGVYTKPSWQSAPGVPADGSRDVPDVSLTAAGHDGYLVADEGNLFVVGGTSASSPSFAGLMALIVQSTGARQGNANTVLYPMATQQYGGGGPAVFHDITSGDNTFAGVPGYSCGPAYDQVTGLGSVDGAALIANWSGSGGCTPPAAPAGVVASSQGQTHVNLSWNPSPGATGYTVYRSTTNGGPYSRAGTANTASFADAGATCSQTNYYVVTAANGTCSSGNSTQAQATTAACGGCTTVTLYSNNFESVTGLTDWRTGSFGTVGGGADWRGVQACAAHSGSQIFRFGGPGCTSSYGNSDFAFGQPLGATGIAVPAGATGTTLSFWHRYDFTAGSAGASLAVSVDGVNSDYVQASAITSGASYNGTLGGTCPPPSSTGAPIFTGTQGSFVNTVVNLDAACNLITGGSAGCAGRPVYIDFIGISGCTGTGAGWFLDDVTVTACQQPAPHGFYTVPPCRVFDTRGGSPLANGTRLFQVSGLCGIPATATAISANLTIVAPQSAGFLTAYPGGSQLPLASMLNFSAGRVLANNAVLPLAADGAGTLNIFAAVAGTANLLLDVNGYFQ